MDITNAMQHAGQCTIDCGTCGQNCTSDCVMLYKGTVNKFTCSISGGYLTWDCVCNVPTPATGIPNLTPVGSTGTSATVELTALVNSMVDDDRCQFGGPGSCSTSGPDYDCDSKINDFCCCNSLKCFTTEQDCPATGIPNLTPVGPTPSACVPCGQEAYSCMNAPYTNLCFVRNVCSCCSSTCPSS